MPMIGWSCQEHAQYAKNAGTWNAAPGLYTQ